MLRSQNKCYNEDHSFTIHVKLDYVKTDRKLPDLCLDENKSNLLYQTQHDQQAVVMKINECCYLLQGICTQGIEDAGDVIKTQSAGRTHQVKTAYVDDMD